MKVMGLCAAVLAAAAFAGCGKSGCTLENCKASIDQCRVDASGNAWSLCALGLGSQMPDAGPDRVYTECQRACERENEGDFFACMGSKASSCSATSPQTNEAVVATCIKSSSTERDPTCVRTCVGAERDCAQKCPTTSADACIGCADQCVATFDACEMACPELPSGS